MTVATLPRMLRAAVPPRLRVLTRPEPAASPPPASGGGFRRGIAALSYRNYRLYFVGQVVSLVGTWMQSVSLPWLVLLLGGSPLELGTVLALQFAPATFLAPLGGVLADRIDKRKVLIVAQVGAMLEAGVLFGLTFAGVIEIWQIMALAVFRGIVSAIEMPVRQSFAAELVPPADLVNAIALNSASFNAARVVGPAVAGVTLALWGPAFNFGLNAISFLAVLAGLWMIVPSQLYRMERPERFASVRSSLSEGFGYALRTPAVLWPLVLLGGMATLAMNFQTLLPLYARNTLGLGADGYGILYATMGVGSLIGSLSLAFMGSHRPMLRLILAGGAVFLLAEVLLGFTRSPLPAYVVIMVVGFASMLMINTINVMIQNTVTDALRGRVMSLYVTVFAGSAPIGGFFAGAIAEVWDAAAAFVLGGVLATGVLAVVAWQLLGHDARRIGAQEAAAIAQAAKRAADGSEPPAAAGA